MNCTLKNGFEGKLYVMYILPQFFKKNLEFCNILVPKGFRKETVVL